MIQRCLPVPLRRLGTAGKPDADLSPAISLGPHPDKVTLLYLKPEHPLHRLEHPVNLLGTGWEGRSHRLIGRVSLPLAARKGRPAVEVALHSNRWQASSRDCGLVEARRDIVKAPGYAGAFDGRIEAFGSIHDAALPCRKDAHQCDAPVDARGSQADRPQH